MCVNTAYAEILENLSTLHPLNISTTCLTHSLSDLAGASKVDNPNGGPLWVAEENILRFEVTVDDIHLWRGEIEQSRAQLLGKLARQVKRDPTEVGVPEQLVEVVGE